MLKNSFVFAAFSGEEEGLVGSEVFVQNSITKPYRPENVVAYINLDMEGCCGGLAASDENFSLHDRLRSAAERLGYDLEYTPLIGASDHASWLRRRVPAISVGPTDLGPFHTTSTSPPSPIRPAAAGLPDRLDSKRPRSTSRSASRRSASSRLAITARTSSAFRCRSSTSRALQRSAAPAPTRRRGRIASTSPRASAAAQGMGARMRSSRSSAAAQRRAARMTS